MVFPMGSSGQQWASAAGTALVGLRPAVLHHEESVTVRTCVVRPSNERHASLKVTTSLQPREPDLIFFLRSGRRDLQRWGRR